jgi:protoporphyrinogen IX oxidase
VSSWFTDAYPWFRSIHILAVIAWMAALLYLPRLFVYHAPAPHGSQLSEAFKVMERRLQRGIMTPAMIAALLFGVLLAGIPGLIDWHKGWIWAKLVLVVGLLAFHGALARWRRAFADDRNRHSARFFRIVNELPTLMLIAVVVLVVVKPF